MASTVPDPVQREVPSERPHADAARRAVTPATYRRIAGAALVSLGAIVVTGAAVRLTGSGLGCDTWPTCESGSFVPVSADTPMWIEFTNRVFTFVVVAAVAVAVLASRRRQPFRADLRFWSYTLVAGVLGNAVVGGIVVLAELSPLSVSLHYLLSAVTIACGTILLRRARELDGVPRQAQATPEVRALAIVMVVAAGLVLVAGTIVTGAGPHGGDRLADRLDFFVPDVARIHSAAAWVLVAVSAWTWWRVRRGDGSMELERALRVLIALEVAQGGLGYLQYALGVPEGFVAVHVFGSVVLWAAAWWALLCTEATVDGGAERGAATAPATLGQTGSRR